LKAANEKRSYFWPLTTLVLALALLAGGYFWLSQSTLLAVEEIVISGNHILSEEELLAVMGPRLKGHSLLKYSYDDARDALRELPVVRDVEIRRDFPHTLHVEVFEYRPVASYAGDGGSYFLSDDARVLSIAGQPDTALPVLGTAERCEADVGGHMECADVLTGIEFIISAPVNLHQEFTRVTVVDGIIDAATLSGIEVHFGTIEDHAYKFEVLRQLIARTTAAGEQVIIDVSVPDRPVTRSKYAPPEPAAGEEEPAGGEAPAEAAAEAAPEQPQEEYAPQETEPGADAAAAQ